jgi:enolase
MMNIINGGEHADTNVDFQEFMIAPVGAPSASPRRCAWARRSTTRSRRCSPARPVDRAGRRGRLRPRPESNAAALDLILEAITAPATSRAPTSPWRWTSRRASSTTAAYRLAGEGRTCPAEEMVDLLAELVDAYPIVSIEDGWTRRTGRAGGAHRPHRRPLPDRR